MQNKKKKEKSYNISYNSYYTGVKIQNKSILQNMSQNF